jgi:glycosyltransferase involved in cell wall biosynthesis
MLSIIIPVYNEESTIELVLRKLLAMSFPFGVEIIVVDDGSTDRTNDLIAAVNRDNVLKVHSSLINLGKGAAVRFGLEYVSGDYVIIQDADLELDPEDIIKLLEPVIAGRVDVVYGSRFKLRSPRAVAVPWYTILANRILATYTNILFGSDLTDMATSYKLVKTEIVRKLNMRCVGFEFDPEITAKLLRLGHRIIEVSVSYEPRTTEQGKKITWWDGFRFMYYLTKYRVQRTDSFVRTTGRWGGGAPA